MKNVTVQFQRLFVFGCCVVALTNTYAKQVDYGALSQAIPPYMSQQFRLNHQNSPSLFVFDGVTNPVSSGAKTNAVSIPGLNSLVGTENSDSSDGDSTTQDVNTPGFLGIPTSSDQSPTDSSVTSPSFLGFPDESTESNNFDLLESVGDFGDDTTDGFDPKTGTFVPNSYGQ